MVGQGSGGARGELARLQGLWQLRTGGSGWCVAASAGISSRVRSRARRLPLRRAPRAAHLCVEAVVAEAFIVADGPKLVVRGPESCIVFAKVVPEPARAGAMWHTNAIRAWCGSHRGPANVSNRRARKKKKPPAVLRLLAHTHTHTRHTTHNTLRAGPHALQPGTHPSLSPNSSSDILNRWMCVRGGAASLKRRA